MKKKGFTLIELLVVISIIALLLSILMPALSKVKEMGRRAVCSSNLKQIAIGILTYAQSNDDVLPLSDSRISDYPWRSYRAYILDSNYDITYTAGFGYLYQEKLLTEPEIFYCPSIMKQLAPSNHYETYTDNGNEKWPWSPDPGEYKNVRCGYSYYPQHSKEKSLVRTNVGDYKVPKIAEKTAELSSTYAISADLVFQWDAVPHEQGGNKKCLNAAFGDGHVALTTSTSEAMNWDLWHTDDPMWNYPGQQPDNFKTIMSLLEP